ncbi:MAG: SRPBCC family protein [Flavobacteriales bacterium]
MSYAIKHLFHIAASKEDVFHAIKTIEGLSQWWTSQTSGGENINETIQFDFGDMTGPLMKIVSLENNKEIKWECIDSPHGWVGNTLTFALDENDGKTRVRFTHEGFPEQDDFFAICNFSWARYMESLRQLCQTGKGEGFGTKYFR